MIFGVPKEQLTGEFRVGLTPGGVSALVHKGATVYIEQGAGEDARFADADYRAVGGEIVFSAEEAIGRSDVVVKVKCPLAEELPYLREGQIICGFLHLPLNPVAVVEGMVKLGITTISYEDIRDAEGGYPIIYPMSELCGRMLPQIAARYLEVENGGRGVLLSGTAGIPAAEVIIIGAGTVGLHAAQAFYGIGAHVTVLDKHLRRLQRLDQILLGKVNTLLASKYNIRKSLSYADVLIGAVHSPFRLAEHVITSQMIKLMRPRGVAIDVSIDQGGCFETSRPTTLYNPTYVVEGITHYCVPNLTSSVARTASHSITNAVIPYLFDIYEAGGIAEAAGADATLAAGCSIMNGKVNHPLLEEMLGLRSAIKEGEV